MTPHKTSPRPVRRRATLVASSVLASTLVGGFAIPPSPASAQPVSSAERFVRQAYVDVVRDADPDQADVDAAVADLAAGESQSVWLWNLLQSDEGRGAFVDSEFARLLDRPVDPAGRAFDSFDATAGVGFDLNPVADALRVITADKNYRLNASTGAVVGEGPALSGTPGSLAYAAGDPNEGVTPQASGAAYTESSRGLPLPTATALFDIDSGTDALVRQNPANAGTLLTVGSLLLDATSTGGFDVSPDKTTPGGWSCCTT